MSPSGVGHSYNVSPSSGVGVFSERGRERGREGERGIERERERERDSII